MDEHLKDLICTSYDPEDIVKLLEVTTEQILERFDDRFEEMKYKFKEGE